MSDLRKALLRSFAVLMLALGLFAGGASLVGAQSVGGGGNGGDGGSGGSIDQDQ
jgi:hypothetical protein